jgi:hypothetical protein
VEEVSEAGVVYTVVVAEEGDVGVDSVADMADTTAVDSEEEHGGRAVERKARMDCEPASASAGEEGDRRTHPAVAKGEWGRQVVYVDQASLPKVERVVAAVNDGCVGRQRTSQPAMRQQQEADRRYKRLSYLCLKLGRMGYTVVRVRMDGEAAVVQR